MARELADRQDRLFGRVGDLARLLDRARFKGLTAVVARPQMGKSWLVTELARRLGQQHAPRHLVGFAESAGQTPDLLLRAVVDLYSRWLSDAGYRQQAEMAWEQQKSNLLPGVAKAVAKMIKEAGQIAKPITGIVGDAIDGLISTNQTLTTGGIQLPTLQYDQARDLVSLTHRISANPIVLVLDQWEQSPDPKFEAKTLHAFLHHLDEWPPCHVFLALRPEEPAFGEAQSLERSLPGTASIYRLGEIDLDANESARMLAYVRGTVPAAQDQSDDDLRELVAGFPGVLYRWTNDYQREHMESLSDLESVARDAQEYRFRELSQLLPSLKDDQKRVAIRLALLPPLGGSPFWDTIGGEVLGDLDAGSIDDLRLARVLESSDPPSFGHAKRWEAVRDWFVANQRNRIRSEAAGLISSAAAPIRELNLTVFPNVTLLFSLLPTARQLELDDLAQAFCQAAASIFEAGAVDETLIRGAKQAELGDSLGTPLLAMGLVITLNHAKAKDDLARRDALLDELRGLARAHPEDATVREQLAMGLFNTLNDAKAEDDLARRNDLLDELRALAGAHPEDAAVRERLAKALYNTRNDAKAEDDLARRNDLLDELRALAEAHPGDAALRELLAKGLVGTMLDAADEGQPERQAKLRKELSAFADAHPDDGWVEQLRMAGRSSYVH